MPDAYFNALKRKKEIEDSMATLNRELAEVRTFLSLHDRFSGTDAENPGAPEVLMSAIDTPLHQFYGGGDSILDRGRGKPAVIANMAEAILKDGRKPQPRSALAEEIERRGVILPGRNRAEKAKYVGTILWRQGHRFENHEGLGYWLKGIPIPPSPTDNSHIVPVHPNSAAMADFFSQMNKKK